MEVTEKSKKRELIKSIAIVFLVVLLILTFFSGTIMNYSLPEVATQAVAGGTINAKIRGTGTASANESYEVILDQTREIRSVCVKVGDTVEIFGRNAPVQRLADVLDTIPYEVLTSVSPRVKRVYYRE